MPKVVLEGHILIPDGDLSAVMAALPIHIQLTRQEEGCLRFEVTQSLTAENVFSVYEEFVDWAAFEAHQRRVSSSNWGKVTLEAQRHYQVTEAD